jgi:hypothetical protein
MGGNLQQTINWAKTFIQYSPLQAGLGQEPAVSIASMIRNSLLNPPLTWYYNRAETTFPTVVNQQDYTQQLDDLAFLEKVSLTDDAGNITEIKDVYNNSALSPSSVPGRPNSVSIERSFISAGLLNFSIRFLAVPDKIYTVTLVYQKLALPFGPFFISAAGNAAAGNTTYTGVFDKLAFPVGSTAIITGFVTNVVNNGSFVVVSCSATSLVVANAAGVAETRQAYVSNFSWDPIPDSYSDVYNNLFLSEAMAMVDDNRSQLYRQRGVAALMAKASGLTEMQKNIFAQQWLSRNTEKQAVAGMTTLGNTGRGV